MLSKTSLIVAPVPGVVKPVIVPPAGVVVTDAVQANVVPVVAEVIV